MRELLVNALKYTPAGGTITVSLRKEGDEVVLSVKDTGIGIPEAEQGKVWNQWYRAPNAQAMDQGTGLGLPIMRETMLSYGGSIDFESKEGKGTTFTVHVPIGNVPDFAMNGGVKDDKAQAVPQPKQGGIDFNPTQMSLQIKNGDSHQFLAKWPENEMEIDAAQVTGATFTIRQMTPVTNLPQVLGVGT